MDAQVPPEQPAEKALKLDRPDVQLGFMKAIETGSTVADAARLAGVKHSTIERWLHRGRVQRDRGLRGKHRAFLEQYELALVRYRGVFRKSVYRHAKKSGWLAMEALARMGDPDFQPVEVQVALRNERLRIFAAVKEEFDAEPETLARFFDAITRGGRGGGTGSHSIEAPRGPAPAQLERVIDGVPDAGHADVSPAAAPGSADSGAGSNQAR